MYPKLYFLFLTYFFTKFSLADQFCNIYCDGEDASSAPNSRSVSTALIFSRKITLFIGDDANMGFATIENGNPGDELWLDRSFDGGFSWDQDSKIGYTIISPSSNSAISKMYNVDRPESRKIGALRACGKAGDRVEIACTEWARSNVNSGTPIDGAATALMQFYNTAGLFSTTGWWNAANCITALVDYMNLTNNINYQYVIDETFTKNIREHFGNFTNDYIDDTLWWGLAWLHAYKLTSDTKYLEIAQIDADYAYSYRDDVCNGGLWWSIEKTYKNAITNELFIKLSAELHNVIPGDTKYIGRALEVWNWLKNSGMFNNDNLINDGLTSDCKNNGQVTWTYNQGVILGGLAELYKATGNGLYLEEGTKIADAVVRSTYLNLNGVLYEPCENGGGDCGGDGPSFKGAFIRNLGELNRLLPNRPYSSYLTVQTEALQANNKNLLNQYGLHWSGPFDKVDGARQHSALDAFNGAL